MVSERLHTLPLLTFVFQFPIFVLWVFGTLLTWLLLQLEADSIGFYFTAGLAGLFAILFFNYGLDVIEYTARGHVKAPPLSEAITGSVFRLFRQCFAVMLALYLVDWTPSGYRWITMSLMLAVAPAVSSFIVFHEPLVKALNPARIYQFMSNMGFGYLALRVMTTSVLLLALYVASKEIPLVQTDLGYALVAAATVIAILMMFRSTGALLHVYRDKLGIRTDFSEEQAEAAATEAYRAEAAEKFEEIRLVFKTKGAKHAQVLLEQELKRHKHRDDALYFEFLEGMNDRRLFYRFCSGYIDRMLSDEVSHAWTLFMRLCHESNGEFRLLSGATLFKMVNTAEKPEERRNLLHLFERFDEDFPQHPKRREAAMQAAKLALLINDSDRAKRHYQRAESMEGVVDSQLQAQLASQLTN